MSELTKTVYYKVTDPSTAYGSFNELIAAHPEVCVEHPDYNPERWTGYCSVDRQVPY